MLWHTFGNSTKKCKGKKSIERRNRKILMEELSQTDLKILTELDKKIEYYTGRIKELEDEKKYFYRKGGFDR